MTFDMSFMPDWETIREQKRAQTLKDNERENSNKKDFPYKIWDKVLLRLSQDTS